MSNAYLILAHNEFEVLQELVYALDRHDNTLFIHYDAKVKLLPILDSKYAEIIVLEERINIYWGHISIVKAQYLLWEEAIARGKFDAYHLISGVHYPLVSQNRLHEYMRINMGNCIFSIMSKDINEENHKLKRYHLFVRYFHHKKLYVRRFSHYAWLIILKFQKILNIRRFKNAEFIKSSQWHILTHEAVEYMVSIKKQIISKYQYTFCPDEYFVLSELSNSPLKLTTKFEDKLLLTDFVNVSPKIYTIADFDYLTHSGYIFARKFSATDLKIIEELKKYNTST